MNIDRHKYMSMKELESLKCGDIVYLRMKVSSFYGEEYDSDIGFQLDFPGCCGGTTHRFSKRWLHHSIIPERALKYDPCRKFKKGDIVQIITHKGRHYDEDSKARHLSVLPVTEDEGPFGIVELLDSGFYFEVDSAYLQLVTPVEERELEPYEVECDDDDKEYSVTIRNKFVCTYPYDSDSFYTKEQAKTKAEAERDRLNKEYREEMAK